MKEKSTFLKILPYLLVVLVVALFAVVLVIFLRPSDATENPPAETDTTVTAPETPAVTDGEPPAPIQTPDDAAVTAATTYTYGSMRLEMPGDLLLEENRDKTRISVRLGTETLPRLDGQQLQAMAPSGEEEIRLAAGLLQAYYADPPETDAITVTADADLDHAYTVETAARGETPAMAARVRFLQSGNELWYLILLHDAGEEPAAPLQSVFESAQMEG